MFSGSTPSYVAYKDRGQYMCMHSVWSGIESSLCNALILSVIMFFYQTHKTIVTVGTLSDNGMNGMFLFEVIH